MTESTPGEQKRLTVEVILSDSGVDLGLDFESGTSLGVGWMHFLGIQRLVMTAWDVAGVFHGAPPFSAQYIPTLLGQKCTIGVNIIGGFPADKINQFLSTLGNLLDGYGAEHNDVKLDVTNHGVQ